MSVRVRFAPSPTGQVHIGNIRVAIFNWLFARHTGGAFLLRIEDTDRERSTPEAVKTVLDAMDWLGLDVDDEPLYQSTRREAHQAAAEYLLQRGLAYKADKGDTGKGEAVLFRMPETDMHFTDEIKGELSKAAKDLKDFVIVRSDGSPVFHLGNVVDDIAMGITLVIRGDDHIENTFRHVALYRALGAPVPRFAHLPMIVNAQGKPYSKRDGAAFVGDYRDKGFLPEVLFNFLALLGWSPGEDREVMTRDEMVALFTLERVNSSAAQMDAAKLEWMNGEYLRRMPVDVFAAAFHEALRDGGLICDDANYLARVVSLMQERTKLYAHVPTDSGFFFADDFAFDDKAVRKRLYKDGVIDRLTRLRRAFDELSAFDAAGTEAVVRGLAEADGESAGPYVHPVRVAVSGLSYGPGLFEMLEVLGKERVLKRLDRAISMIKTNGVA
ncbi:MAG: glutamate--tRNA ligase [Verrucomicrobia bacterium]|nr:glutamate--tRNA ligase [Verrucomicrobiota bacterium]